MVNRTSIFSLLAAALAFSAPGAGTTTIDVKVDGHMDEVRLTPALGPFAKNSSTSPVTILLDTDFTVAATGVSVGYTACWQVLTNGVKSLPADKPRGSFDDKIKIPSTPRPGTQIPVYAGSTLSFYGEPNTYAVTLDRQSGSGGTSSVTATYDAAMPSITVPTRAGHAFGGAPMAIVRVKLREVPQRQLLIAVDKWSFFLRRRIQP